ncbi:MAG: hypothetical protein CMM52_10810 [Rhodospirillaceae bacterium]|nr:hypothetical protein [Rhodospirillaceae bacterium]|tara:strand:+ start:5198 stop:5944 length:747 start_codon:yes stop_codon:yes gene_type:complete
MDELTIANIFNLALATGIGVAAFNGMIHGYTGFGGALLTVPVLTFLYGPVEAIGMVAIISIFGASHLAYGIYRLAEWRSLIPICLGIALLTPVGAWILFHIDGEIVRRSMGGFILAFALILFSGWSYRGPRGLVPGALVGGVAGCINGLTGIGGPPLALYQLSAPLPVEVQRANIVVCIIFLIITMFAAIAIGGGYSALVIVRALIITPAYIFGVWVGSRIFAIAPKSYFKNIALLILIATGLAVLVA